MQLGLSGRVSGDRQPLQRGSVEVDAELAIFDRR